MLQQNSLIAVLHPALALTSWAGERAWISTLMAFRYRVAAWPMTKQPAILANFAKRHTKCCIARAAVSMHDLHRLLPRHTWLEPVLRVLWHLEVQALGGLEDEGLVLARRVC